MNVAIGIGTLLLGGWVFNTPVEEMPSDATDQVPVAQSAAPANAPSRGMSNQNPERMVPREDVQQQLRNRREPESRASEPLRDERGRRQTNAQTNVQRHAPVVMPTPPTDSDRSGTLVTPLPWNATPTDSPRPGTLAMPSPPTARNFGGTPTQAADPFASPTEPKMPDVRGSRQVNAPQIAGSPSSYNQAGDTRLRSMATEHPGFAPQPPATKAFAEARPYSSGVSPYMGLFRNDTNGGTIDNYTTFVRPALDQRSMNQQFNMDIYGLTRNARIQNAALQEMGRGKARAPQSIGTPQFYMNYGNYFPSYGE